MMERDGDLSVPADKLCSDIARLPWEIEKEEDTDETSTTPIHPQPGAELKP